MLKHGGSEVAIIREEDKAAGVIVKRADRIDPLGKPTKKIAECLAAFRVGESGHDFRRFVHEQIDMTALGFDEAAGGFDFVFGGISLGPEFRDDLAVDANLAGQDELFGMTAGGDSGVGNDFLEAFKHEFSEIRNQEAVASSEGRGDSRPR